MWVPRTQSRIDGILPRAERCLTRNALTVAIHYNVTCHPSWVLKQLWLPLFIKNVKRISGNSWEFSEFPEFPGFPGISRGFWGENSRVFSWFTAAIVCRYLQNGRFPGDDFRDFPEFPEFPENFRKIPEFRNFGNPKKCRNFRKFPATGFFQNFLYFFIIYALYRLVASYKKL